MNYLNKKTVEDIDVSGKKVLVRCDFNVPFDENGNIADPKRINEALKTIKYLVDHKAKVILCSHLGLSLIHISIPTVSTPPPLCSTMYVPERPALTIF